MTQVSLQVLSNLGIAENVQWYVAPSLVLLVYLYNTEIKKKSWGNICSAFSGLTQKGN